MNPTDNQPPSEPPDEDVFVLHATSEQEPIKLWLIAVIMGLMFFGGMFLWANSGGFQADVYDTNRVSYSGAGGAAAAPDPMVVGKSVFTRNCAVCHQPNGLGVPGQFPPLVGSEWVLAQDWHGDNHIVKIVIHGFQGPVTVKGLPFNNQMAPWGKVLKDEQIAAVLTYVRNEWGNKAPPIPKEFVTKLREQTKDRQNPWTAQELQAIPRETAEQTPPAPAGSPGAAPAQPGSSPAAPAPSAPPKA
jgi:mono/diheme cytochrome c family protein